MSTQTTDLLPGEKEDLVEEARAVLGDDAEWWLDCGNSVIGGQKPRDFIESGDPWKQEFIRDWLRAIREGAFS